MSDDLSRLLRWPLWSWRNLAVTTAGALAALALLGQATGGGTASTSADVSTPEAAAAPTPSSTTTPRASHSSQSSASATVPTKTPTSEPSTGHTSSSSATAAAQSFVAAWARPQAPRGAWVTGMRAHATPRLLGELSGVSPAQVPASRVEGDASLVKMGTGTAVVRVPTDGGQVEVGLVREGDTWRANTLAPADSPPAAATPGLNRRTSTG